MIIEICWYLQAGPVMWMTAIFTITEIFILMQLVHEADQRMYEDKAEYYRIIGHERRRAQELI